MTPTTEAPTTAARSGGRPAWWLAGVAGAAVVLAVRDPNTAGSYGFCPLKAATGLDCPFCGGLRASHDLLVGDVVAAFDQNVLVPLLAVVVAAVVGATWLRRARSPGGARPRPLALPTRAVVPVLALLTVFTVVRNLPGVPFLGSGIG
ncbi:MAG: DUF2752 domain-containing protein [Actinomycetota bacterium]|nr:DUF2752 domain-containing protein [Actinomycetota bacterium]